jgi:hypothetical protein
MKLFYLVIIALLFSGCVKLEDVKPWQKGTLAKDTMTPSGGNAILYKYQKHIYFSKEASKGGGGVAGGGCGCN